MLERRTLADHSPEGKAGDMGRRNPVAVEQAKDVIDRVVKTIARPTGRIFGRKAGISLVVADDKAAPCGEPPAEFVRPPQHGCHPAHDQEHGRILRVAEGLGGDFYPVLPDYPCGRLHLLISEIRSKPNRMKA